MSDYQEKQKETIEKLEKEIQASSLNFSTVAPVGNYEEDSRLALTSVHLPHEVLVDYVQNTLIKPLQKIEPNFYYYSRDSIHMTIKNIRVINEPPILQKMI